MNNETELTKSIQDKIDTINDSIEIIHNELFEIKSFVISLKNLTNQHTIQSEINNEYNILLKKMTNSIEIIDEKLFLTEINGIKKIKKTNSGNYIELKNYTSLLNSPQINYCQNINDCTQLIVNDEKKNNQEILNNYDINLLYDINFDINIFEYKKEICELVFNIFNNNLDFNKINIDSNKLKKIICEISKYYHNNPYHNFKHACQVVQFTHLLINKIDCKKYFTDYEIFGILMAALVHDIDHPGHTNAFEINTHSHLALKYNDKSVLENHHCSLAFYLIYSKEIKLFENIDEKNISIIRNIIIESVLSTDIKYHSELIDLIKKNLVNLVDFGEWDKHNQKNLLCKIIVHLADISNHLRPFDISIRASKELKKEFENQIENEKKYNLPISEFMRIIDDKTFYFNEYHFSTQIVKPIWDIFVELFPETNEYYQNLILNIDKWKNLLDTI